MYREHLALNKFFPTLKHALDKMTFEEIEAKDSCVLEIFRDLGGPGLLVPQKLGGFGATPLEAMYVQKAIASLSPSLGVATNMHHCTIASIYNPTIGENGEESNDFLSAVASESLYVASGFTEGKVGQNIFSPFIDAESVNGGFIVNGTIKPCHLSESMDYLTTNAVISTDSKSKILALLIILPNTKGFTRKPFWNSPILAAAESGEIVLKNVFVPADCVIPLGNLSDIEGVVARLFVWFELMISSTYLGMASTLVRKVHAESKGTSSERALFGIEIESLMPMLESVADFLSLHSIGEHEIARSIFVRFAVQQSILRSCTS